ncbi:hypothetical protein EKH55_2771 [Sinorhizobium alkalisoli]|nr:hypothetical protein EKH55_2771 [Sinorhizobium alkalisoli]
MPEERPAVCDHFAVGSVSRRSVQPVFMPDRLLRIANVGSYLRPYGISRDGSVEKPTETRSTKSLP